MKPYLKRIMSLISLLLVLTSCSAFATQREELAFPELALAQELTETNEFRIEKIEEIEMIPQPEEPVVISGYGLSYLTIVSEEGTDGSISRQYQVVKGPDDQIISKLELPDETQIIEPVATTYQQGASVQIGATFTPRFTRYGADCAGCTRLGGGVSASASGIRVTTTSILQPDGTWLEGITYGGRYLFASNSDLPMCTLITIDNHSYSGMGVNPDEPIYGIIGDRGVGANHLDFFVGSEKTLNKVSPTSNSTPTVTITGFGEWTGRGCNF